MALSEEQVLMDIEAAKKMISNIRRGKGSTDFSKYCLLYSRTNENVEAYMEQLKDSINDKKVLTVCSTGDQAIATAFYGAKEIDLFDCNRLSYYFAMLKIAALKALDYKAFLYCFYNKENIDFKAILHLYPEIARCMDDDAKLFWNSMLKSNWRNPLSFAFNYSSENKIITVDSINALPFLKEEDYNVAKDRITKSRINFEHCEMSNIPKNFSGGYGFINLSNIARYIEREKGLEFLIGILNEIDSKNLDDNGEMLFHYKWYNTDSSYTPHNEFERKFKSKILTFPSTTGDGKIDGVYIHSKKAS